MAFLSFPSPTQLRNLSDPASNQDAATKAYVDSQISGGTGTIVVAEITATGNISANSITSNNANLGNAVDANYFIGDGLYLSNIPGANVTGTVANATYAVTAGTANSVAGANVSGTVATANYAAFAGNIIIASQPNVTSVGTLTSLTVSGITNLGAVGNLRITGGSANYILKTDGTGNVTWAEPAASSSGTLTADVDSFTGDGVETAFTLTNAPLGANYSIVVVQGIVQPKSVYTISGSTLTFSSPPPDTADVEVTTFGGNVSSGGGGGASSARNIINSYVFGS